MNKKKIIVIIAILLLAIWTIIKLNQENDKSFSRVTFDNKNSVINQSEMIFVDTIVMAGLHELNIDSVKVLIRKLDVKKIGDIELKAYILPKDHNNYIIYIEKNSRDNAIEILAHELIHLQQFHTEKLLESDNVLIWDNNIVYLNNIPEYLERPWEIEAFENQTELKNRIKILLYR